MNLIDSNIIIYSALKEYAYLRELFKEENVFVSEISLLEVLGYSSITKEQENYFNAVFSLVNKIPVSTEIIFEAIRLRKNDKLSVGDSIIAASAIGLNLTLLTNNVSDFKKVKSLQIKNPIKA
ncbi:MAG: type II toxin-antitoxin system VapC family toxin [Ignavibacterium sp.]|nr:type II toxin-antitoxin system VapC family toxin [Ignavibacterium sp.]